MNALEKALYEVLGKAESVATLLADGAEGIHADEADQNASFPHIVFNKIPGPVRYSFEKREWEEFIYQVKAVATGESPKVAQTIAEAVDAVLSDGEFTIPGHTLMYSRKISDMPPITQRVDAQRYNHRGGRFEIWVGPAA